MEKPAFESPVFFWPFSKIIAESSFLLNGAIRPADEINVKTVSMLTEFM